MAFKRSTVRSRPSPPEQRNEFSFLCFFILFSLFKRDRTVSPSRAVRLGGARGTYNRGFAKQMRGACPLDPVRLHQDREMIFRFSAFFILFYLFKRDRTVSPSRAVRLGGARGTYNRGFAKQMRGACPLNPVRLHQKKSLINKALRFMSTFFLFNLKRIFDTFSILI